MNDFPDGLVAMRKELDTAEVMRLIERCSRWVDRATFEYLPVWYPELARNDKLYNVNWSERRMNRNSRTGAKEHKHEGNTAANTALTHALGLRPKDRPNWSCCHIWGVDDASNQESNLVVQDKRFYTCISNMVLLPTPLKAFTDAMPEVKMMLRVCAYHNYGWLCQHKAVKKAAARVENWKDWDGYPESWPRPGREDAQPKGTIGFTNEIKESADRRITKIRKELQSAGKYYPKKEVKKVLRFWNQTI